MPEATPKFDDPAFRTLDGNLFDPVLRRDIADLNRQFLTYGLDPVFARDPRFQLSEPISDSLVGLQLEQRRIVEECPFSLFELVLPTPEVGEAAAGHWVNDQPAPRERPCGWMRCHSFSHSVLAFARRLAEGIPLSIRLSLGLPARAGADLVAMRPSEIAHLALWPGLIRPRWQGNRQLWELLIEAARSNCDASIQWAHCVGMCQLWNEAQRLRGQASTLFGFHKGP